MPLVLAHAGPFLAQLMYVAPVIVVVVWISLNALRDRRRGSGPSADQQKETT